MHDKNSKWTVPQTRLLMDELTAFHNNLKLNGSCWKLKNLTLSSHLLQKSHPAILCCLVREIFSEELKCKWWGEMEEEKRMR